MIDPTDDGPDDPIAAYRKKYAAAADTTATDPVAAYRAQYGQAPATDPTKKAAPGSALGTGLFHLANSLTLGLPRAVAPYEAGAINVLKGGSFKEGAEQARQRLRDEDAAHPIAAALGDLGAIPAGIGLAMAAPLGAAPEVSNLWRTGRAAATAFGLGAVNAGANANAEGLPLKEQAKAALGKLPLVGLLQSDNTDPTITKVLGSGGLGAAGLALPLMAGVKGGEWAYRRLLGSPGSRQTAIDRAGTAYTNTLAQDAMTPADAEAAVKAGSALGKPVVVSDVAGPTTREAGRGAAFESPRAAPIREFHANRGNTAQEQRLLGDITGAVGQQPAYLPEQVAAINAAKRAQAAPFYAKSDAFGEYQSPAVLSAITDLTDGEWTGPIARKAWQVAKAAAAEDGKPFATRPVFAGDPRAVAAANQAWTQSAGRISPEGIAGQLGLQVVDEVPIPNATNVDYFKKGLDDVINSKEGREGLTQRLRSILIAKKDRLLQAADAENPDYATARSIWTDGTDTQRAAALGDQLVRGDDPRPIQAALAGKPFTAGDRTYQLGSDAERQAFKEAGLGVIRDRMHAGTRLEGTEGTPNLLNTATRGYRADVLRALSQPDAVSDLENRLATEQGMAQNTAGIVGNSQTAARLKAAGKFAQAANDAGAPVNPNLARAVTMAPVYPRWGLRSLEQAATDMFRKPGEQLRQEVLADMLHAGANGQFPVGGMPVTQATQIAQQAPLHWGWRNQRNDRLAGYLAPLLLRSVNPGFLPGTSQP